MAITYFNDVDAVDFLEIMIWRDIEDLQKRYHVCRAFIKNLKLINVSVFIY
ncbi:hypothetical protein HanXRQr2_Chr17g0821261 [Helianthus annuus]|uniref:Uncharacterized protein n=1 Tax=Helianthus annuus TaxID=4232 RepID=A0A9K3DLR4_HELAN|nr:hypothetical protein HanXRQr2_Chr17g0821261 [Helianthus annuus]KAJ0814495.1 hypothetical protein HanPSC8_Chr17g0786351 [Helianthus annuus]